MGGTDTAPAWAPVEEDWGPEEAADDPAATPVPWDDGGPAESDWPAGHLEEPPPEALFDDPDDGGPPEEDLAEVEIPEDDEGRLFEEARAPSPRGG